MKVALTICACALAIVVAGCGDGKGGNAGPTSPTSNIGKVKPAAEPAKDQASLKGGSLRCEGSHGQPVIFFDTANGRTYAVNKAAENTGTESIKKLKLENAKELEKQGAALC